MHLLDNGLDLRMLRVAVEAHSPSTPRMEIERHQRRYEGVELGVMGLCRLIEQMEADSLLILQHRLLHIGPNNIDLTTCRIWDSRPSLFHHRTAHRPWLVTVILLKAAPSCRSFRRRVDHLSRRGCFPFLILKIHADASLR